MHLILWINGMLDISFVRTSPSCVEWESSEEVKMKICLKPNLNFQPFTRFECYQVFKTIRPHQLRILNVLKTFLESLHMTRLEHKCYNTYIKLIMVSGVLELIVWHNLHLLYECRCYRLPFSEQIDKLNQNKFDGCIVSHVLSPIIL